MKRGKLHACNFTRSPATSHPPPPTHKGTTAAGPTRSQVATPAHQPNHIKTAVLVPRNSNQPQHVSKSQHVPCLHKMSSPLRHY